MTSRTETHLPLPQNQNALYVNRAEAQLADAARAYCSAMHANKDVEPVDWERARAEVDRTYYELMKLCGYFDGDQD